MRNVISCPECNARLGEEYIRCPRCHAFVLDSSPWRSDHNLFTIPMSILIWWGLWTIMTLNPTNWGDGGPKTVATALGFPWVTAGIFGDTISAIILLMAIYGILVLITKLHVTRQQSKAMRTIRELVSDGELGPRTLELARERLRGRGLSGYNRYIAYHRLQWLLSAEAADRDIRLGLLEAQRQHADTDWDGLDSAFSSAGFLVWLLPSVGFLGTVWGMTVALSQFQGAINKGSDLAFNAALAGTAQGLGTAFHTTLVGLACVIPVLALATIARRRAQNLLEHTDKYFIRLAAEQLGDPTIPTADAGVEEADPETDAQAAQAPQPRSHGVPPWAEKPGHAHHGNSDDETREEHSMRVRSDDDGTAPEPPDSTATAPSAPESDDTADMADAPIEATPAADVPAPPPVSPLATPIPPPTLTDQPAPAAPPPSSVDAEPAPPSSDDPSPAEKSTPHVPSQQTPRP